MRRFLISLCALVCVACSTPPPGAIPGRIAVVSDTRSPFWSSLIGNYVPRGLNDYANYDIVDGSRNAPYTLRVRILNADSYVSNYSVAPPPSRGQTGSIRPQYRTMVEVEAGLFNQRGQVVWNWSGWADYGSAEKSVKAIAKMLGKEMSKSGLLAPSYYE